MGRFELIQKITEKVNEELVVCNLGLPSRELYNLKDMPNNFYMLGSMGMVSSIGFGLSLFTDKKVIVIDGDGSILMNLSSLVTTANYKPKNLIHIIIDNKSYGSTGNQPTLTSNGFTNLAKVAKASGIENVFETNSLEEFSKILEDALILDKPTVIIVNTDPKNVDVPIIPLSTMYIKKRFMKFIRGDKINGRQY